MYRVMALYEVSLFYYENTANSTINRNLGSVISNWNDFSKCFYELLKSLFNDQNKLRVSNKRSFMDNPYLFLAMRFMYSYTHYQAISVTVFL